MDEVEFWAKHGGVEVSRSTRRRDGICPMCGEEPRIPGDAYCRECRRAYGREWMRAKRKSYGELSDEQRKKVTCRSYSNVLKQRGKLAPQPCKYCGVTKDVEMHHPDYNDPKRVEWVCQTCHRGVEHQVEAR